ncbi:MAG TPA: tRNA-dihydrouridine synthase family protein, partial [Smithellaceae bacterium]|nr:tRNA-dihydrouridine synthase family protein [Smithellaceae bacterium]
MIKKAAMIYLAPVQGITDRVYRNLFAVYFKGVDLAVTPFISSVRKIKAADKMLRDLHPGSNMGIPTIPQIMSSDPEGFIKLANALYDVGCDTVNWNLGCPFSMVVKKGRGAGMLCYPDRVESFLEKVMPAVNPKLSIKLRIGFKDPADVLQLLPVFNNYPLEELIIHPRTGLQMYKGTVDLAMFTQCLQLSRHRVVYNGDIDSAEKFAALANQFEVVDRWMIGRGLIGNPFLAEEIKSRMQKPYAEKVRILRAFHDDLLEEYSKVLSGPAHITNKMKEIWTYMGSFLENAEKIRKKIWKTHHRDHYIAVV